MVLAQKCAMLLTLVFLGGLLHGALGVRPTIHGLLDQDNGVDPPKPPSAWITIPANPEPLSIAMLLPLGCAFWLAWTSFANRDKVFAPRLSELAIVFAYIALSAGSTLALRQTKGSAVGFTVQACLVLYVLKATMSLGLLIFKRDTSFASIVNALCEKGGTMHAPVWCQLALTGTLFASYDALSFLATQHMPPVSFQLLLNCRLILLVPLQRCLLHVKITTRQVWALVLIGVAGGVLVVADMAVLSSGHVQLKNDYSVGVALILGKVVLSALGLVVNEKMLKELPLTIDAQNLITYCFGAFFLGLGLVSRALSHASSVEQDTALVLRQMFFDGWMLTSVLLMAALGIVCAYLLKAFSAVEKEVMSGGVVALVAIGQVLTPGEHKLSPLSLQSALTIMCGGLVYRLNMHLPEGLPTAPESSKPKWTKANQE